MNAKYTIALILALQVSMSLCDIPEPDQELVDKYNTMKSTFYKRLLNAYGKLQVAAAPMIEKIGEGERGAAVKDLLEDLQSKPEFQAIFKFGSALFHGFGPLVDKARMSSLRLYQEHLRPEYGQLLSEWIDRIKAHLDKFLPAEPKST
ncbi:apolipoprotein A-II [Phycodurus eques]|uniref:apolipoprotein A-II n=1 Tax=Phycodurus eques TaxID=693459 RepID=UPI002ACD2689|nr:apolipoprotein A-II [Phycodurus eques]